MDSTTPQLSPDFSETESRSMDSTTPQLSLDFNLQEVDLMQRPPLGLKLTISPALIALLRRVWSAATHDQPPSSSENVGRQMASNFPVTSISIGPTWRRVSRRQGDLTAKLYFAKRKLVWEFLEGPLKVKIEVSWSDITAINAHMPPSQQPGTLQIQLGNTPSFFRETPPQPRKHTNWEQTSDFTDGHALLHRIHYAIFPHGELNVHYPKLLQSDQRLFELSKNPFPSQGESPYFNTACLPSTSQQLPFSFTGVEQNLPFNNPTPSIAASHLNPMSVVSFPHMGESSFHMGESSRNDNHQTPLLGDHRNSFHEASFLDSSQLRVTPGHHMISYNQPLLEGDQGLFLSEFNQIQNINPSHITNNVPANSYPNLYGVTHVHQPTNLYGVTHVHQPTMENIAPTYTLEGSNIYGGEQWPELGSNIYGPELGSNIYGPELGSSIYGGVTAEQRPELDGDGNIGNNMNLDNSMDLYSNHHPFNLYRPT